MRRYPVTGEGMKVMRSCLSTGVEDVHGTGGWDWGWGIGLSLRVVVVVVVRAIVSWPSTSVPLGGSRRVLLINRWVEVMASCPTTFWLE